MLFLVFQLGRDWYALQSTHAVEILPRVLAKEIPQSPNGVAGVFNYHGTPVPLIDLAAFASGEPSRSRMSTRIILIDYAEPTGQTHLLGLIAEEATDTIRREESDFVDAGVSTDGAPYLGRVTKDRRGLIQRFEPSRLLPQSIRDVLFRPPAEA